MPSDTSCAGGPGFTDVKISGTLGGIPIQTEYGNCTGVGGRWVADLAAAGLINAQRPRSP